MKQKIYVAMSGGVDSSVAAALARDSGYEVVGVFMKFWSPAEGDFCLWREERADAMRVAAKLEIPLLTWDFAKEYERKVVSYMVDAYRSGITPNPDVMCNKDIKFGLFFDRAISEGADMVATGHYARIERNGHPRLLKAVDKNKDQSYFLYLLKRQHLERTIFPIGEYPKSQVRELARQYQLPTSEKKDSQGVCFIGPIHMKNFLKEHISPRKGLVVHKNGRVLGEHDGAYHYTIGQRHGLDLKNGSGPYYVVDKDVDKNVVVVGSETDLWSDSAQIESIHWIGEKPALPAELSVKIRYRSEDRPAILDETGRLNFTDSVRAITPGQAAVFYRADVVLGGGTIIKL